MLDKDSFKFGSVIRVPLTNAHRRLGTLGIRSQASMPTARGRLLLQLLSREVALVIDDALNLGNPKPHDWNSNAKMSGSNCFLI